MMTDVFLFYLSQNLNSLENYTEKSAARLPLELYRLYVHVIFKATFVCIYFAKNIKW